MDDLTRINLNNIYSEHREVQNKAFMFLIEATE